VPVNELSQLEIVTEACPCKTALLACAGVEAESAEIRLKTEAALAG
jgi:hypothetical protein